MEFISLAFHSLSQGKAYRGLAADEASYALYFQDFNFLLGLEEYQLVQESHLKRQGKAISTLLWFRDTIAIQSGLIRALPHPSPARLSGLFLKFDRLFAALHPQSPYTSVKTLNLSVFSSFHLPLRNNKYHRCNKVDP